MSAEKDALITVIVPIYNAEHYLTECLNSVLGQTYRNIEVICVNDGSTDGSLNILESYARAETRIRIISQSNQGVSAARNAGLATANGTWVVFVDADDTADRNLLSAMLGLTDSGADFVITHPKLSEGYFEPSYATNLLYAGLRTAALNPPWAKLYSRRTLTQHQIFFDTETSLGEDLIFNLRVLMASSRVATTRTLRYFARKTEGSLTRKYKEGKYGELMYVHDSIDCLLAGHKSWRLLSLLNYLRIKALLSTMSNARSPYAGATRRELRLLARSITKEQPNLCVWRGDIVMLGVGLAFNTIGLYNLSSIMALVKFYRNS